MIAIAHDLRKPLTLLQQLENLKSRLGKTIDFAERFREFTEAKRRNTSPLTKHLWTIEKRIQKEIEEMRIQNRRINNVFIY